MTTIPPIPTTQGANANGQGGRPMKTAIPWLLFVLSLAFNVFFAVGYFQTQSAGAAKPKFEERARQFAAKLDLDADQMAVAESMIKEMAEAKAKSRLAHRPLYERFLAEVRKPEPDEKVLAEFAQFDRRAETRKLLVQQMRQFMSKLRPEQQETVVTLCLESYDKPR